MSVFNKPEEWADDIKACGAPHQSPVNLSRSFALPCDRLCELVIDEVSIPEATVSANSYIGAVVLTFGDIKPTARFNGEGYTAKHALLFRPAQHTIEDVRAEAEFVVLFEHPKGYYLAVSVTVRTAPGDTPSTNFFSAFVPYPAELDMPTTVVLGSSWGIQDIVPESKGFYVYEGSWVIPNCFPNVTWCVFNSSITIDPSDFAKMASKGKGGSRPLQPVGDRQVFFNDGEDIDNTYAKRDGKVYMRCRRVPREDEGPPTDSVKKSDLAEQNESRISSAQATAISNLQTQLYDSYASTGGLWAVMFIFVMLYLTYMLFFNDKGKTIAVAIFRYIVWIPNAIHRLFTRSRPSP
jgi:carbonic anhydrase